MFNKDKFKYNTLGSRNIYQNEESDKSILLWNPGDIQNVVLHGGFNLHRIPKNYFTRKSYIENLIYHAITSDNMKSPFSGYVKCF